VNENKMNSKRNEIEKKMKKIAVKHLPVLWKD